MSKTFTVTWAALEAHIEKNAPLPEGVESAWFAHASLGMRVIEFMAGSEHYRMEYNPNLGSPKTYKKAIRQEAYWKQV